MNEVYAVTMLEILERIAKALESIDDRLDAMTSKSDHGADALTVEARK